MAHWHATNGRSRRRRFASAQQAAVAFVDDTSTHVIAAGSFGWSAHYFQVMAALRDWLSTAPAGA